MNERRVSSEPQPTAQQHVEDSEWKIAIDLGDLIEDVGSVTLKPASLARAIVTLLQRARGGPFGRPATPAEAERQNQEMGELRQQAQPVVSRWLKERADDVVNRWIRTLLVGELFGPLLSTREALGFLEEKISQGHLEVFAVPSLQDRVGRIREGGTSQERKTLKRITRLVSAARAGRPVTKTAERADVKITAAVEQAKTRLKSGFDHYSQKKTYGRFGTDDHQIVDDLKTQGYTPAECEAIIGASSPAQAAKRLVASEKNMSEASVASAASRGKKRTAKRSER